MFFLYVFCSTSFFPFVIGSGVKEIFCNSVNSINALIKVVCVLVSFEKNEVFYGVGAGNIVHLFFG